MRAGPPSPFFRRGALALVLAWTGGAQVGCALGLVATPGDGAARDGDAALLDAVSPPPSDGAPPPFDSPSPPPPLDGGVPPSDAPSPPPLDTSLPPRDVGLPPGTCAVNSDCAATPSQPVCNTATRRCVRCLVSGDCPTGQMCTSEACVPMCECMAGATRMCATSCGTGGVQTCGADCRWASACAPPAEACNLRDDDCNGRCDDRAGCRVAVNRSYSAASGEHFYTTSATEAMCCGFTVEFANYYYLYTDAQPGTVPFYRCYLTSIGKHFYTTSSTCEGAAGTNEGSMGFIATAPVCGSTPLYRLVHRSNGDHLFTTSTAERDMFVSSGAYLDEGVAGHVWSAPSG